MTQHTDFYKRLDDLQEQVATARSAVRAAAAESDEQLRQRITASTDMRLVPGKDLVELKLVFACADEGHACMAQAGKSQAGKEILEKLVKHCDVLVENFAPGALDRMGFTWERIQQLSASSRLQE